MHIDVRGRIVGRLIYGIPQNLEISVGDKALFYYDDEEDFTDQVTPIYNTQEFECSKVTVHSDEFGNFIGVSFGELTPKQVTE